MKNGIKSLLIVGLLLIASVFAATAYQGYGQGTEERGTFHEDMVNIVEEGTYEDLEAFREENGGFGGPRWVTDQTSFEEWQEKHQENYDGTPGYLKSGQGKGQRSGGCPFMQ